jgi:hypothetical protein
MKKGEVYEGLDEKGRKIKFIVTAVAILEDGTTITRTKSLPVGVVSLECGHKVPIFDYDFESFTEFYCFNCKVKKAKTEIKWRWLK